ncbi:unnamed protein product [Heterobilharzia americana]|nr:unnamed protein product [Heterobilharzia americana]
MMLPHSDGRQIFFVVQLDPPIKHGQTRYHFNIFLFDKDSHVDSEMTATEKWLQQQFNGKLTRNISGPEYEVVACVFKVETRIHLTHTFTSIERDEYHDLYHFVTAKKLRVKNIGSENKSSTNAGDDVWSSSMSHMMPTWRK